MAPPRKSARFVAPVCVLTRGPEPSVFRAVCPFSYAAAEGGARATGADARGGVHEGCPVALLRRGDPRGSGVRTRVEACEIPVGSGRSAGESTLSKPRSHR